MMIIPLYLKILMNPHIYNIFKQIAVLIGFIAFLLIFFIYQYIFLNIHVILNLIIMNFKLQIILPAFGAAILTVDEKDVIKLI